MDELRGMQLAVTPSQKFGCGDVMHPQYFVWPKYDSANRSH
jgi:hypothetical protein